MNAFTINIPESTLDDLKQRIKNTRWPDEITNSEWEYGANLCFMKELADYWLHTFNWKKVEQEINAYPNYIAEINSYKIHFLHVKGKGRISLPLILTHGWPGSFLEMIKLIPLLTEDPEFSFDLVIPSMMGFGFSQKIVEPGCNVFLMAELWVKLMKELGYSKFIAQGGDFGAGVSTALGLNHSESILGIHLNYIPGSYRPYLKEGEKLTDEEMQFLKNLEIWYQNEGGYIHQQKTKPLTLAYGLSDSPVGLCAWMIEKFYGWADCKGNLESSFTKDELLANVTLYWITETIHSSIRLYNEASKAPFHFTKNDFVKVPVGIAHFPYEDPFPPRTYIERGYNIKHWTDMFAGGHFASMEQPELLANDIVKFAKDLV